MIALLIIAVIGTYLVGAIFGYRAGYVGGYEHGRASYRMLGERSWRGDGLFFGAMAGIFWPVALPAFLVVKHLTPTPPSVKAAEREELLREQAATIARLEREAGIR